MQMLDSVNEESTFHVSKLMPTVNNNFVIKDEIYGERNIRSNNNS